MSLRRTFASGGPKPIEKPRGRMPTASAAPKWPELVDEDQERQAQDRDEDAHARDNAPSAKAARLGVGCHELLDVAGDAQVERLQERGHDLGDIGKPDSSLQERLDGDLVRGVEDARCGPAALARLARQREQRECLEVGRVELQRERRSDRAAALWSLPVPGT